MLPQDLYIRMMGPKNRNKLGFDKRKSDCIYAMCNNCHNENFNPCTNAIFHTLSICNLFVGSDRMC